MFTTKTMLSLDYFSVLSKSRKGDWELQSKNTGHCWKLIYDKNGYYMYHKHHQQDPYHYQTDVGNIYDVVLYIVGHDEFQLRGRKNISRKEELKRGSYFFKLIDIYGLEGEKA